MATLMSAKRLAIFLLSAAVLLTPLAAVFVSATPASARAPMADPAFSDVWTRADLPVAAHVASRSWMWGPDPFYNAYEQYTQGPAGQHLVSYFDKARMEINNPSADRRSPWYVTNGLLVVDMLSGRVQVGDNQFVQATPNNAPVAGDAATSLNAPTYASLATVASLNGNNRATNRTGQPVMEGLGRTGPVGNLVNLGTYAKYAVYEPTLGHNVADVFWTFLNQRGTVYQNGRYEDGALMDWLFVMGYPVTEPYWINIKVGSEDRWVLMQAFQRRILTYSPFNPEGWKLEMGNVGRAYYDWRYQTATPPPPAPTPTPRPAAQASITITPDSGTIGTRVTVTGRNFPAKTNVNISIENSGAGYARGVASAGTDGNGSFEITISLPSDAISLDSFNVAATANGGSIKAVDSFDVKYAPQVGTNSNVVSNNGSLVVHGEGYPGAKEVRVGMLFDGTSNVEWRTSTKTNGNGQFDVRLYIGSRPIGSQFKVIAIVGTEKASSTPIKVVAPVTPPPTLVANPNTLYGTETIVVTGGNWPAHGLVQLGVGRTTAEVLVGQTYADANGNISLSFVLPARWRTPGVVTLVAWITNGPSATTWLHVLGSGGIVPGGLPVSVNTYHAKNGATTFKLDGQGWPAGKGVVISIISSDGAINVAVAQTSVRSNGTFNVSFGSASPWYGRNDLGVKAVTTDGQQNSVRYLPVANLTPVNGSTYNVSGSNWEPGKQVNVIAHIDGRSEQVAGTGTADALGRLNFNVVLPKIPGGSKNSVEIRSVDQTYSVSFGY